LFRVDYKLQRVNELPKQIGIHVETRKDCKESVIALFNRLLHVSNCKLEFVAGFMYHVYSQRVIVGYAQIRHVNKKGVENDIHNHR